jgi:hypothetical protein
LEENIIKKPNLGMLTNGSSIQQEKKMFDKSDLIYFSVEWDCDLMTSMSFYLSDDVK